jgi:hypothetical protein
MGQPEGMTNDPSAETIDYVYWLRFVQGEGWIAIASATGLTVDQCRQVARDIANQREHADIIERHRELLIAECFQLADDLIALICSEDDRILCKDPFGAFLRVMDRLCRLLGCSPRSWNPLWGSFTPSELETSRRQSIYI